MKKILFVMALVANIQFANAQDEETVDAPVYDRDYNKWSVELGVGGNKPNAPFAVGYSSSDPSKVFNLGEVDHFEGAIRYMLTNKFGLKLDASFDKIRNSEGSKSPEFETQQIRGGLQGVINLGRLLSFEEFTSKIGVLVHFGVQMSMFTPKTGPNVNATEYNGGLIYGITPQVKLTNRVALYLDITMMSNIRQHYTWDGQENALDPTSSINGKNLTGEMLTTSAGLHIYLGGNEKHADWYASDAPTTAQQEETAVVQDTTENEKFLGILARLDELEKCTNDSDEDGVNDCIDEEEDTKKDAFVDTKGRTIEKPKDGKDGLNGTTTIIEHKNPTVIQKGSLLNIFYDVNKDTPNAASAGDISLIVGYMIANPESKIRLIGYADTRGGAATNLALSQRRAKNLTAAVVSKGVNANRVRFDGFGTDKKVTNPTREEMDYARRTEVIVE